MIENSFSIGNDGYLNKSIFSRVHNCLTFHAGAVIAKNNGDKHY